MSHITSSFWFVVQCFTLLTVGTLECFGAPVTTIKNSGDPSNRVDFVILGDGYTAQEMNKFAIDVDRLMLAQFNGFFAEEPFQEYAGYFNVHRIDVISNESGADHPDRAELKDTAFDAAFNCGGIPRLVCVDPTKVNDVLDTSIAPNQRDIILVIINDAERGGGGDYITTASVQSAEDTGVPRGDGDGTCDPGEICFTNPSFERVVLHEIGHSFGLLADEYVSENGQDPACHNTFEPPEANVTRETNRDFIKWNTGGGPPLGWIDPLTLVPTRPSIPGVPGLYEGAKYCITGLYRPTPHSKMEYDVYHFEQINEEQLVKRIYNFVSPLETSRPASSIFTAGVGEQLLFEVEVLSPATHALEITWFVDGQVTAAGTSFALNTTGLGPPPGVLQSMHNVGVLVRDTTAKVRNDPSGVVHAARLWDVYVRPYGGVADVPLEAALGECLWHILFRGRDECLRLSIEAEQWIGPHEDTALQARLVLSQPGDDLLRKGMNPADLADQLPKQYKVTVTGYRRVAGKPPRQRNPELISHLVVVAFNAEGQVLSWIATPDPRLIRAEGVDSPGHIPEAKMLYWPRADFSIALPYDQSIRTLGVYEPEWTGKEFILKPIGDAELPDQRRSKR